MSDELRVYIVDRGRSCLYMRYIDPVTGKAVERSTRKKTPDEAKKAAGKWEAELQEGRYKSPSRVTWAEFRRRYEDEVLRHLAPASERKSCAAFNAVEKFFPIVKDGKLNLLTADRISRLSGELDGAGLEQATINGHLACLKASLRWANRMGMLIEVPRIQMLKRAKGSEMMKGRPMVKEEFDRLLLKVPTVVGKDRSASWSHTIEGLWWSGLRLGEALDLWWDREDRLCVVEKGERLMILIHAHLEKGKRDRLLPIAPEFETFLRRTPKRDRRGLVFKPLSKDLSDQQMTTHHVGIVIGQIGEKSRVKVGTSNRTKAVKFASAHTLRRSFGTRWARRVKPAVLQQLMRHATIETTLKYYVDLDAGETAAELWKAVAGDTLGDTSPVRASDSSPARQKARRK
ncbi:MAG TPA: site-specific integrase [Planctomycetaceae bacterium]|nr:site-specific integrase [Planctomycetaceae bacterium]